MNETVLHTCGYPLLRRVTGRTTCYYEYRDAHTDPRSQTIRVCPQCGGILDIGTVQGVRPVIARSAERMMSEYGDDMDYLKDR